MLPIVKLNDVSKSFVSQQRSERVDVFRSFNMCLGNDDSDSNAPTGRIFSILGRSGCGKTTLLNLISGLDKPESGEILVRGKRVAGDNRLTALVPQQYTCFPWLTAMENVAFGLRFTDLSRTARVDRATHSLNSVGLLEWAHAYPHELSGGMRQRVAIARTIAIKPSLILMDEPFGALDSQVRHDMQLLLLRLVDETSCSVVFVTHDINEAVYLGDEVHLLPPRPASALALSVTVPFEKPRIHNIEHSTDFLGLCETIRTAAATNFDLSFMREEER